MTEMSDKGGGVSERNSYTNLELQEGTSHGARPFGNADCRWKRLSRGGSASPRADCGTVLEAVL